MSKMSFLVGAGVGYVLGARAGRAQYEKIKKTSAKLWESPKVQDSVHKVESRVADVAKERGAAVTDKVASGVKSKLSGSRRAHASEPGFEVGNTGRGTDGPMEPTPPQPSV